MKYFVLILLLFSASLTAQNTIPFIKDNPSPKATLANILWIEGHWKGEAFGGTTEEIWSPPSAGSMMFSFKHSMDGKVNFYEFGHICEIDGSLVFELKHFGGDLKGWEEKNDKVSAKLVKMDENRLYFDDFTFEKISDDEMNIYVVIEENGNSEEVKFNYKKEKP